MSLRTSIVMIVICCVGCDIKNRFLFSAAPLEVSIQTNSTVVPYGGDAELVCMTSGFPGRQSVMWLKKDELIRESNNIHIKRKSKLTLVAYIYGHLRSKIHTHTYI